jgi:hypothetical protein
MTLLITTFAAIISSIVWYNKGFDNGMKLGTLVLMYWGAAIMWFVDAIAEYNELGAEYFTPAPMDMLNDAYLGFCVVALGLIIWFVILLIKDPNGVVKKALLRK